MAATYNAIHIFNSSTITYDGELAGITGTGLPTPAISAVQRTGPKVAVRRNVPAGKAKR